MIKGVQLIDSLEAYQNSESNSPNKLTDLSKINLSIGQNNSGKSRFQRKLFENIASKDSGDLIDSKDNNYLKYVLKSDFFPDIKSEITKASINSTKDLEWLKSLSKLYSQSDYIDYTDLKNIANEFIKFGKKQLAEINKDKYEKLKETYNTILARIKEKAERIDVKEAKVTFIPTLRTFRKFVTLNLEPKKKEIPLRGTSKNPVTSKVKEIPEYIAQNRYLLDYFVKGDNHWNYDNPFTISPDDVFTGETLFEKVHELQNSPINQRKSLTQFEQYLSRTYFDSKDVELRSITQGHIKDIYVKIGNQEFPIFQLGDGIQSIIILTFPLFFYQSRKHILFIEEPEQFLHPGMQRDFFEAILSFNNVQCFISTHSNHLLGLSYEYQNDTSIYSFHKDKEENMFIISNLKKRGEQSILDTLGIHSSSVLMANCSIWVEGASDRIYFKHFLDLYLNEKKDLKFYSQDVHYMYFEFGGNNITHWEFSEETNYPSEQIKASNISKKIMLIHDKDEGKDNRHNYLKSQLGEQYHVLEVRETENLLTPKTIKNVIEKEYSNSEKIDHPEFDHYDYKNSRIGDFIVSRYKDENIKKLCTNMDNEKTSFIKNKVIFAQNSIKYISKWSDLSIEAQNLTKEIYNFIKNHN